MSYLPEPGLLRDLTEAKAAVIMHGIVILRAVEVDLEPAIMSEAKSSIASSPRKMASMSEDELDELVGGVRKSAIKACLELKRLYTKLLTRLGTESVSEVVKELDGVRALFTWERVSKSIEAPNKLLSAKGFRQLELEGPEAVSEGFKIELEERWPEALDRFASLAVKIATELEKQDLEPASKRIGRIKKGSAKR